MNKTTTTCVNKKLTFHCFTCEKFQLLISPSVALISENLVRVRLYERKTRQIKMAQSLESLLAHATEVMGDSVAPSTKKQVIFKTHCKLQSYSH